MLSDKMAISHSNHLFVPVAFVFCLLIFLSPLIHASNSHNYTDSRQFEKNPVVSRHGNNIQRLPNYNWKPPDKYYGPRKESTEENLGMEFTKPEDPEQGMADPRIKKMQEISRQEREKWAAYRRNVKLTLDNVEETRKAGKLTNDESITIPVLSKSEDYYKNIKRLKLPLKLAEKPKLKLNMKFSPAILKMLIRHPSMGQDSTGMKDKSSWSNSQQSADTNVEESNKKLKSDEWSTNIKNLSEKFLQKASATATHQRHKDYEIFNIKEESFLKQNAATDYEKGELEKDRPSSIINSPLEKSQHSKGEHILKSMSTKFSENDKNFNNIDAFKETSMKKDSGQVNSTRDNKQESSNDNKRVERKMINLLMQRWRKNNINLHPEESISQQSKIPYVFKSLTNNLKAFSEIKENLNFKINSLKFLVKKYPRQSSSSQDDNEENNEDSKKDDEKTIARSVMWKSKKEKDSTEGKDMTEKLNYERSFHSGRWGMNVASPPAEFLKDMSRRLKHRRNKEHIEKDGKHHFFGRWGMSVVSPPKEFLEDVSMHGAKHFTVETGSRSNEEISDDRPPIHQNRQNLQMALIQQLMTNERNKKLVRTLLGKVPNDLYGDFRYPDFSYWNGKPTNIDIINSLFLKFLEALQSYTLHDHIDIPMSCHIRIPYTPYRI